VEEGRWVTLMKPGILHQLRGFTEIMDITEIMDTRQRCSRERCVRNQEMPCHHIRWCN